MGDGSGRTRCGWGARAQRAKECACFRSRAHGWWGLPVRGGRAGGATLTGHGAEGTTGAGGTDQAAQAAPARPCGRPRQKDGRHKQNTHARRVDGAGPALTSTAHVHHPPTSTDQSGGAPAAPRTPPPPSPPQGGEIAGLRRPNRYPYPLRLRHTALRDRRMELQLLATVCQRVVLRDVKSRCSTLSFGAKSTPQATQPGRAGQAPHRQLPVPSGVRSGWRHPPW